MEFIQSRIAEDFGYSDDKVMESLEECLKKLQVRYEGTSDSF